MNDSRRTGFASASPGGGDISYRTQSLKYGTVETVLDESVTWTAMFRLWLIAFITSFVVWLIFLFGGFMFGSFADTEAMLYSSGIPSTMGALGMGTLLGVIVFWLVMLLYIVDEPISEWKVLLEDKAEASTSAYATIYKTLTHRRIPLRVAAVRVRSDLLLTEAVNSRLEIRERSYTMYVSVFPYGTSLYVGWTMWRRRRGYLLIGHFLKDLVGGLIGRSGSINQALRTETIRAMREAAHAAVREGVEAAVSGIDVPLAATFGQNLPVQDLRSAAVPASVTLHPQARVPRPARDSPGEPSPPDPIQPRD